MQYSSRMYLFCCCLFSIALGFPANSQAQLDLQQLHREKLPNGLTLLVLEEHSFPSVSVQMLYRVGGRNEPAGQSGIAHFLEHMAFRASEHFPDTDVVSQIYAAGGEWHGYTWIDQTTYFATVPSEQLDLLLRIEADRMQRLLIEPRWIEPEKGAVLAEMHGYENDPASVLHDAVVFAAFQGHPYRNNVIGWESDIQALQHADVLDFYRSQYRPANAVLAVVGNVDAAKVSQHVNRLFRQFPPDKATPLPHTVEPQQRGERRLEMLGDVTDSYFEIAWRAPAAHEADFAAMLVAQQWLTGGTGVNFMQEYGTTSVQPGSALYGVISDLASWYPPAAQEYLFSINGSIPANLDSDEGQLAADLAAELAIEQVIEVLRSGEISDDDVQRAVNGVLAELVFDLGTHEEAAHQLAYFDGLNALDHWLELPERVARITKADLVELANRRLHPWQRTIGWYKPKPAGVQLGSASSDQAMVKGDASQPAIATPDLKAGEQASSARQAGSTDRVIEPPALKPLPSAEAHMLDKQLPLLLQNNPAAASAWVSLVIPGNQWQGSTYLRSNHPVWGVSSLESATLPGELSQTVETLLGEVSALQAAATGGAASDPVTALEQGFEQVLGLEDTGSGSNSLAAPAIAFVVMSGQLLDEQLDIAGNLLGAVSGPQGAERNALNWQGGDRRINWPQSLAQAQLGYVVAAPMPTDAAYLPWRALQYIVAHDYEGRLGKEAISNRGLVYYIDSQYRSDGQQAWSSLSTGVDPAKMPAMEQLFRQTLQELATRPPGEAEIAEAKSHLDGRLLTARQSNAELAAGLAEQWLWYGELRDQQSRRAAIQAIDRQQVLDSVAAFSAGAFVVIESSKIPADVTD